MKYLKIIILTIIMFISSSVKANELVDVSLSKCIDGDTAYFYIDGTSTKVRFLAIDTPESTNKIEKYGKEASEYTCNKLTNAKSIRLEYDSTNREDKYGRVLAWIYVDGNLLQKDLVSEGLAEVAYIYGDYEYTNELCKVEKEAYDAKRNVWEFYSWKKSYCSTVTPEEESYESFILIVVVIVFLILGFIKFIKEFKHEK